MFPDAFNTPLTNSAIFCFTGIPANGANGAAANGVANGHAPAGSTPLLDPVKGNVAFASCAYGYCFTLKSFAQLYKGVCGVDPKDVLLIDEFAKRLWGDVWYYQEERVFRRKPPQLGMRLG